MSSSTRPPGDPARSATAEDQSSWPSTRQSLSNADAREHENDRFERGLTAASHRSGQDRFRFVIIASLLGLGGLAWFFFVR
jgi:hypothetical protein